MKRKMTTTILLQAMAAAFVLLGTVTELQAQRAVSGTVTSADDEQPLPGVNIVIQGTTDGTVTDVQGNYEITIQNDRQGLVYSMVGMKTVEKHVGGRFVSD